MTPINCDPSSIVRDLRKKVGGQEYRLYADAQPVPRIDGIDTHYELRRPTGNEGEAGPRAISGMHAKIYAFHCGSQVDLFWGSANLSYSAWRATGKNANVDFLIHSTTPAKIWRRFRDKALPPGHAWKIVEPSGHPPKEDMPSKGEWLLLHARIEKGCVWLESTGSANMKLRLRTDHSPKPIECLLAFRNNEAMLPPSIAKRLGFHEVHPPRSLQWFDKTGGRWLKVPVNNLDVIGDESNPTDLAQQLFWEYTGRLLPIPGAPPKQSDYGKDAFPPDEEELIRSEHQGELDRFVLVWRSIARRVIQSCDRNIPLKQSRTESILARIDAEAQSSPRQWPEYRQEFVRKLLRRQWQK